MWFVEPNRRFNFDEFYRKIGPHSQHYKVDIVKKVLIVNKHLGCDYQVSWFIKIVISFKSKIFIYTYITDNTLKGIHRINKKNFSHA